MWYFNLNSQYQELYLMHLYEFLYGQYDSEIKFAWISLLFSSFH